jgi:ectonucleotide pyrophosphatase/phosphodiesterase family protein 1/3
MYTSLQKGAATSFTFQSWLKESLPVEFHYVHADRVGPIVLQAEIGYTFTTRLDYDGSGLPPWPKGMHGYPSDEEDMDAIFIGHGSAFTASKKTLVPAFENVELYQLMVSILGLKAEHKDGSPLWFQSLKESKALADWVS